ncbi:hypothetical protein PILCRDRAFT_335675 [Piloderma croceum F 1598]|uniref:Uncharacterized protein n=1 Tax=Piloderma croceum (strain F 1598) TaxID=765440 RepID=A0A0C3FPW1_PILCF|nr:hypothetical protein PILCRDRAFT_335675 [Piloderma croceum F 1598]
MNDEVRRQLYLQWRVSCVGLTMLFYAVVPIDHRFRLVTLTPTFSCIQSLQMVATACFFIQPLLQHRYSKLIFSKTPRDS